MFPEDKSDILKHMNYEAFDFVCENCPKQEVCEYEYESEDCICSKDYNEFINKLYEAEQIMYRAINTVKQDKLNEVLQIIKERQQS